MPRIVICKTCQPAPDADPDPKTDFVDADGFVRQLGTALDQAELPETFEITQVDCMGSCSDPTSVALQGTGRASYLFAGLSAHRDIDDIIATCREYLNAPDGWMEDARGCGRLRFCLKARIPAL